MLLPSGRDALRPTIWNAPMPIWPTTPVDEMPELRLSGWQVVRLRSEERHLIDWNIKEAEGRVSSCVERFDAASRRAVTRSGRVYELCGAPGAGGDAQYTWAFWRDLNRVDRCLDVTDQVWAAIEAAMTPQAGRPAQEAQPCALP